MQAGLPDDPFWLRPWPWPVRLLGWVVLLALALILHWRSFESEDVAWLLVAAERVAHGGRWGADILEVNTPGAVLLYLPPALAAEWLPVAPLQACAVWICLILAGCASVAGRVVARICGYASAAPQAVIGGYLIFSVLAFGSGNFDLRMFGYGNNFGQRDVMVAALLLPMLWLMLWPDFRRETCRALHRLAIAMAVVALCIKPQFGLPFALWIVVALYRHGWRDAFQRAGLAWLVPAGIVYIALVLLAFPEWLGTARLALQTYDAYRGPWNMVLPAALPAVLLLTITGLVAPSAGPARPLLSAATIASASYVLLALIEQKPWFYHVLPGVLTPLVAICLAIVAALPQIVTGRHSAAPSLVLAAVIPGVLAMTAWRTQQTLWEGYQQDRFIRALHGTLAPGDPWAVISVNALPAFPASVIEGYRWVLRGPSLWPLPGAVAHSRDGESEAGDAIRTAVAEGLAADIEKGRPKAIVVDPRPNALLPEGNLLALLLQTPEFAKVWAGYRLVGDIRGVDLYVPRANP